MQELIHPEDRRIVIEAVAEALRGGPRYDVEYRVVRPNGEVRIVHSQGDVTKDESGRPRRMFGTVQDITESKRRGLRERAAIPRGTDGARACQSRHDDGAADGLDRP